MELTKDNIWKAFEKAKEDLIYKAIDCSTGNPVDLRDVYNLRGKDEQRK